MKTAFLSVAIVALALISLTGCGGTKTSKSGKLTFKTPESVSVKQGDANTVDVTVDRKDLEDEATVTVSGLPKGVNADKDLKIAKGGKNFKIVLKADADAEIVKDKEATITAKAGTEEFKHALKVTVTEGKAKTGDGDFAKKKAELDTWYNQNKKTIDADIANLKERGKNVKDDAKKGYDDAVKNLEAKRDALAKTYGEAKDKTEAAWGEFKTGLEKSWDELSKASKEAADKYK